MLFNIIVIILTVLLDMYLGVFNEEDGIGVFSGVYSIFVFIPELGVTFRRLHDVGKSGWWILLRLIPLLGPIVILFWMIQAGDEGENKYGPNPNTKSSTTILR